MDRWTTEATKRLVESYYDRGLLTTTEAAELEDLVDRGMPDIALALLHDIDGGSDGGSDGRQEVTETEKTDGGIVVGSEISVIRSKLRALSGNYGVI